MDERIEREADPADKADIWAATFLLMGLIYPDGLANTLLQGKSFMRESSTYQAILREGKAEGIAEGKAEGIAEGKAEGIAEGKAEGIAEEAKRLLRRLGRKHFGPPSAALEAWIDAITDVEKLEELSERVLDVSSWDDLIAKS
jgi:flagellar biosynthesis/type III secretory pathway protein FliH